jgi:FlgD Ig-like domain
LLVSYYGVYAAAPSEPVLSPNGDGEGDRELLSYKVVRPSTVTAKIVGPDGVARYSQSGPQAPGTYKVPWSGTKPDGRVETEGRWHWVVTAVDDLGRQSSVDQPFWLNNTLGNLRTPAVAVVGGGRRIVVARFALTHPAKVTSSIVSANGVVIRKLGSGNLRSGAARLSWNGRDRRGNLVYGGRFVVRIRAQNQYGLAELTQAFTVRRR